MTKGNRAQLLLFALIFGCLVLRFRSPTHNSWVLCSLRQPYQHDVFLFSGLRFIMFLGFFLSAIINTENNHKLWYWIVFFFYLWAGRLGRVRTLACVETYTWMRAIFTNKAVRYVVRRHYAVNRKYLDKTNIMKSMGNYDETLYLRLLTLPLQFFMAQYDVRATYLTYILAIKMMVTTTITTAMPTPMTTTRIPCQHTPFPLYFIKYFVFRYYHFRRYLL